MARTKKLSTKIAAVALAAAVVVGGGTFAYLQASTDAVENQFNSNQVLVDLKETTPRSYEVIPGTSEEKDPTVYVNASVDAWVFVTVEDELVNIADWSIAEGWTVLEGDKDDAFVLYREVTGSDTEQTFPVISGNSVSYPASLTNSDMEGWTSKTMTFQAYAIQQAGFDTAEAAWNQFKSGATVSDTQPVAEEGNTELSASFGGDVIASASVPEDAVAENATSLTLTVKPQEASAETQEAEGVSVELADPTRQVVNYDVKIEGVAADNTAPITVNIFVGTGLKNVKVYHSGTQINDAAYDSTTGIVSFTTTSFSDYTVAYDLAQWVNSAAKEFSSIDTAKKELTIMNANELALFSKDAVKYAGYTVKLGADIDLGGKLWTPISGDFRAGTTVFDGNNHTVSNMTVNVADKSGAGLFGAVIMNEIKNVKVTDASVKGVAMVGGIVGSAYAKISNCSVSDSTLTAVTDASGNDGAKAGGIVGLLREEAGDQVLNCSVSNVTINGYRDLGGVCGSVYDNNTVTGNTVKKVTINQFNVLSYTDGITTTLGAIYGRVISNGATGTLQANEGSTTINAYVASVADFTVKVGDKTYKLVADFDTWKNLEGDKDFYYADYLLEDDTLADGLKAIRKDFGLTEMTDAVIAEIAAVSYNTDDTSDTVMFKLGSLSSLLGGGNSYVLSVSASGVTFVTGE